MTYFLCMNVTDRYASNYALKGLIEGSLIWKELTSLMCWDGVKRCASKAGIISSEREQQIDAKFRLVSSSDFKVVNAYQIKTLEAGNVLGFFEGPTIIHCMLCIGEGKAAGNKNDCIGMGKPMGWECIDLSNLQWDTDGSVSVIKGIGYDGNSVARNIRIHYRPISYLK